VNLSVFSIFDPSQIKDLACLKNAKAGMIHILYGVTGSEAWAARRARRFLRQRR
jgi:hypothetical protein